VRRLDLSKQALRELRILEVLERYAVPRYAYGFCEACQCFYDYWKYGEDDFDCPGHCGNRLRELTPGELGGALRDCERDGCFKEEFLENLPLKPVLKTTD
jgi:hypothetical protein